VIPQNSPVKNNTTIDSKLKTINRGSGKPTLRYKKDKKRNIFNRQPTNFAVQKNN
jgi:hypothetical protein